MLHEPVKFTPLESWLYIEERRKKCTLECDIPDSSSEQKNFCVSQVALKLKVAFRMKGGLFDFCQQATTIPHVKDTFKQNWLKVKIKSSILGKCCELWANRNLALQTSFLLQTNNYN